VKLFLKNGAVLLWLVIFFILSVKMKPVRNGKDVPNPLGFFISRVNCSTKHEINCYIMINGVFRTWKGRKVPPVFSTSYNCSASPNGANTDFFVVWLSLACYSCWWWHILSLSRVRRSVRSAYHMSVFQQACLSLFSWY